MMARFVSYSAHRALLWLSGALLLVILFVALLPVLMRYGAITILERQGAGQVTIEDIDFNPFTGEFAISHLATGSGLLLDRAGLQLEWWPLWRQQLVIKKVHGDTLRLNLEQRADGSLVIGGMKTSPATGAAEATPSPWSITLPSVDINHIALTIHQPAVQKQPARTLRLSLDNLYMDQLSVSARGIQLAELRLDGWSGEDTGKALPKAIRRIQLFDLSLDAQQQLKLGTAEIWAIQLSPPPPLRHGSIDRIKLRNAEASAAAFRATELQVDGVDLPAYKETRLGRIGSLHMTDLQGRMSGRLQIKKLALQRLTLPADAALALGDIAALRIDGLVADQAHAAMEALAVTGLRASLLRRPDGTIATPALPFAQAAERPGDDTTGQPATPFQLRIGSLSLAGDSRLAVRDETVQPAFKTEIAIRRLDLAPLKLGTAEAGELGMELVSDKQATLTARGSLTPEPAHFAMDLTVELKELNLPRLSPYIERAMQIAIRTGQLDLSSKAEIAGGALKSQNTIHIRSLQVEAGQGAPSAGGMPVNMALDMIRDDKGDIDLKVPLQGPLDDLQAGIGDVINKVLMTALQKAVLAYASQYLYPYGTIISVASRVAKMAKTQPALTPVTFVPGSSELDEQATGYSVKIAALLKAKGKIRLRVCGVASPAEFTMRHPNRQPPADEQLLDLAQQRSARIVEAIGHEGIASDRLYDCKPAIDRADSAGGRVELLLE